MGCRKGYKRSGNRCIKQKVNKNRCRRTSYRFNEGPRKHRCTSHCHCDGARTCSRHKWCQGKSRPTKPKVPRCKKGFVRRGKRCVRKVVKCKKGFVRRGKRCVRKVVKRCKKGFVKRGKKCVRKTIRCRKGWKKVGTRCVKPTPTKKGYKRVKKAYKQKYRTKHRKKYTKKVCKGGKTGLRFRGNGC